MFFKFTDVRGFSWFLKSIKFSTLSRDKTQYLRSYSDAVWTDYPEEFQQKETKSDLLLFSTFPGFKGASLTSQNLKDYFERVPNKLFVPNLTASTLLSWSLD